MNFSQELIKSLDVQDILFRDSLISLRDATDKLLQFPELNKIVIREKENELKERAGERSKLFNNYLRNDAIDAQLNSVSDFLECYSQVTSIMVKCGSSLDQNMLLAQIKKSIRNKEDETVMKPMTGLSQAVNYLCTEYAVN